MPTPDLSVVPPHMVFRLGWIHGFQEAYYIYRQVKDCDRILIVGESSGRDSFHLRAYGKEPVAMDVASHPEIPGHMQGDATGDWPFPDGSFDAVIMSEILEHLFLDVHALAEARRVLADHGVLVVTVPFLDDSVFHARLHSPRTIRMLLQTCGFSVQDFFERGALLGLKDVIEKVMAIQYRIRRLSNPQLQQLEDYYPRLVRLAEWNLTHRLNPRGLFSQYWGGYLTASKGPYMDFNEVQQEWFKIGGKIV